jgi:hypothetical protein
VTHEDVIGLGGVVLLAGSRTDAIAIAIACAAEARGPLDSAGAA